MLLGCRHFLPCSRAISSNSIELPWHSYSVICCKYCRLEVESMNGSYCKWKQKYNEYYCLVPSTMYTRVHVVQSTQLCTTNNLQMFRSIVLLEWGNGSQLDFTCIYLLYVLNGRYILTLIRWCFLLISSNLNILHQYNVSSPIGSSTSSFRKSRIRVRWTGICWNFCVMNSGR